MIVGVFSLMMVGGCGGGEDSSTTLTKAEFTKQANAVCASSQKARKAGIDDYSKKVEEQSNGKPTAAIEREVGQETIDEAIIPSLEDQLQQLEDLGVPAGDEAKVERMLNNLSLAVGELEGDGLESLNQGGKLADFTEEARDYGLECAF
jgi:hypothetical protein